MGTQIEQHETKVNVTTHRPGDIFAYKDIWEGTVKGSSSDIAACQERTKGGTVSDSHLVEEGH